MSSHLKRALGSTNRPISPPARRRKLTPASEHVEAPTRVPCITNAGTAHDLRVFSWNVNGIGPLIQKKLAFEPGSLSPLRLFLRRHDWPHFLCLQEVKINSKDAATQRALEHAANRGNHLNEPTYTARFALPRDKFNATGFGGKVHGVATLIRDDVAAMVDITRDTPWDLEGRVLIHELKNGLVIINGYWVNGTSNPYRDPVSGQVAGTRHDHKLRFHALMLEETLRLQRSGRRVVLIGDMNIARSRIDGHPNLRTSPTQHIKNRADFNSKFFTDPNGMQGIDVFRHLRGEERRYTYHPRGRDWGESGDRVDLIVVSRSLVESDAVVATGILDTALERGHSDHVPLWVVINLGRVEVQAGLSLKGENSPNTVPGENCSVLDS